MSITKKFLKYFVAVLAVGPVLALVALTAVITTCLIPPTFLCAMIMALAGDGTLGDDLLTRFFKITPLSLLAVGLDKIYNWWKTV